jgi:type II secretory ATPase GspE/PulE/Tfp pilus assembly ATPase PilB-like protein
MTCLLSQLGLAAVQPVILVGFIQPILMIGLVLAWAWLVATKLDKDAMYFHMPRRQWNAVHAIGSLVAVAVYMMIPQVAPGSSFWLNLPVLVLLLAATPFMYMIARNKKVPEDKKFRFTAASIKDALQQRRMQRATRSASINFKMANGEMYQTPPKDDPAFQVHLGAEEVLLPAFEARATNITFAPAKSGEHVMMLTVDGITQKAATPPTAAAAEIITYFKQLGQLDITDRRRRQRATIEAHVRSEKRELKLVTDGSAAGMRLMISIDPTKQVSIKIDDLGLLTNQRSMIDSFVSEKSGVVLIAGGPRQGRTTTMYDIISLHDAYLTNVQMLELEQERQLEGVRHDFFDPAKDDAEYWTTLRALMRRDPDVVGVVDMVDAQTPEICAEFALEGPRIYLSVRADNGLLGLQAYLKAVGNVEKAASSLRGIVGVKLCRELCETCRVPYQPTAEAIKKLNLPAQRVKQLYKAGGKVIVKGNNPETCPDCGGSGYLGQTGIYEVMDIGEEEQAIIKSGDLQALRASLRKKKTMFMQDVALMKAIEGVTSIEEVNRVMRPAGSSRKKAAAPAPAASGN